MAVFAALALLFWAAFRMRQRLLLRDVNHTVVSKRDLANREAGAEAQTDFGRDQ